MIVTAPRAAGLGLTLWSLLLSGCACPPDLRAAWYRSYTGKSGNPSLNDFTEPPATSIPPEQGSLAPRQYGYDDAMKLKKSLEKMQDALGIESGPLVVSLINSGKKPEPIFEVAVSTRVGKPEVILLENHGNSPLTLAPGKILTLKLSKDETELFNCQVLFVLQVRTREKQKKSHRIKFGGLPDYLSQDHENCDETWHRQRGG